MIGILSDAHGNKDAFRLAISVLKIYGAKQFIFLGDAVGYIPSLEVLGVLRRLPGLLFCIRGNHEDMLLNPAKVDPTKKSVYQLNLTRQLLSSETLIYLQEWPKSYRLNFPVGEVLFVHGGPYEPTYEYVYPDSDLSRYTLDAAFVFMGHTHYPFIRSQGKTTYVNVGSCGLPRDQGNLGSVALFDPVEGAVRIIRFDISKIARTILDSPIPIHSSVIQLFERRRNNIFGEVYEI